MRFGLGSTTQSVSRKNKKMPRHRDGANRIHMQRRIIKPRGESKLGIFSRWQPHYAAHNVATFPVLITQDEKKPAVTNFQRVGLPGSAELASKRQFADASAFGFMTGPRSKVTVLDVDA